MTTKIRVEVEKIKFQGTNKAQRPFFIHAGFAHLPGVRYPQEIEFYSEIVLNPGTYDVPATFTVEDKKIAFTVDFQAAQPTAKAAA